MLILRVDSMAMLSRLQLEGDITVLWILYNRIPIIPSFGQQFNLDQESNEIILSNLDA